MHAEHRRRRVRSRQLPALRRLTNVLEVYAQALLSHSGAPTSRALARRAARGFGSAAACRGVAASPGTASRRGLETRARLVHDTSTRRPSGGLSAPCARQSPSITTYVGRVVDASRTTHGLMRGQSRLPPRLWVLALLRHGVARPRADLDVAQQDADEPLDLRKHVVTRPRHVHDAAGCVRATWTSSGPIGRSRLCRCRFFCLSCIAVRASLTVLTVTWGRRGGGEVLGKG